MKLIKSHREPAAVIKKELELLSKWGTDGSFQPDRTRTQPDLPGLLKDPISVAEISINYRGGAGHVRAQLLLC